MLSTQGHPRPLRLTIPAPQSAPLLLHEAAPPSHSKADRATCTGPPTFSRLFYPYLVCGSLLPTARQGLRLGYVNLVNLSMWKKSSTGPEPVSPS